MRETFTRVARRQGATRIAGGVLGAANLLVLCLLSLGGCAHSSVQVEPTSPGLCHAIRGATRVECFRAALTSGVKDADKDLVEAVCNATADESEVICLDRDRLVKYTDDDPAKECERGSGFYRDALRSGGEKVLRTLPVTTQVGLRRTIGAWSEVIFKATLRECLEEQRKTTSSTPEALKEWH
jgi:hypothetical protein